jgi:sulfatase maturation enzyme AslB (radical SAM superfamily)
MTTKQIPQDPVRSKLEHLIERLARESFYGEVNITFQNGKPLLVKVNQTYKMNDL